MYKHKHIYIYIYIHTHRDRHKRRYDTYMEVTKPVLEYYSKKNNFYEVDGSMEIINISQKIEEILNV